ncbi:sugar ABC transporter substrate-binding protein [Marinithermus hydrothermalis]|uniref:Periplasmic binding protein/LacI transcriptional regulator n=1 Tax=Marinithermus hydrothermalis (strain DSM 14884 / JCM 11576 / T1) TaxID=869210 RepID=F2NKJ4_MARHT|nr:sugar ABC transporter substrate-binding protein [Marinithermus hydrothermalis]AEB12654.1 periplasmic binding protein/LacI transcriptional regulator [Marinithermus hydrothermalis DSM 14884]
MKRWVLTVGALLLLGLGFGSAQRIVVVTHGTAADPFWSVVKNGVDQAARDMGVRVEYRAPATFDLVQMSQLIDAAVASKPDALVVSIPDADALGSSIRAAVEAGIPVISINSGFDVFKDLGVLLHIGQEEFIAGKGAGERMKAAGVTRAVCINQEVGNLALDLRCQGFEEGLGGDVEVLGVRGDFTEIKNSVAIFLRNNPDIQGILTLGPVGAEPTLAALEELDLIGKVVFGTFDLGPTVLEALAEGKMSFAIDQQQYLQGYLPIVLLTQYIKYGVLPAEDVIFTGPGFVTPENAAQVIELSEEGFR